ncbi:hypothetical protein D6D22_09415 [Aureobasidium pullulans]|uniref:Mei2-like C-terminal RNA recognition motif domain-containing protein n=1 Tax=Aureobasidium pullulans TaxID=5580 RepID=A0A4S8X4B9_AURPU|nr:hypothetical protein D6D22_09415 [Aureobasidium pullulans]
MTSTDLFDYMVLWMVSARCTLFATSSANIDDGFESQDFRSEDLFSSSSWQTPTSEANVGYAFVCALCGLMKRFAVFCATTRGTDFLLAEFRNSVIMEEVLLTLRLDKSSFGHYDFSYLRIDFSTELNVGYAFVNFTHPEHITNFVNAKVGKLWSLCGSTKRCEVSYATIQGIDCLLAKVRNRLAALSAAHHCRFWHAAP